MAFCRFTPRQLEVFIAVHEDQGFGAAAQRLALTPAAVSQLVAELEEALGFRLFDRTTRRVALTAAGSDFLPSAAAVISQLSQAERAAADLRRRITGQLPIAVPQMLAATLLPAVIEAAGRLQPDLQAGVRDTPVEHVVQAVASA